MKATVRVRENGQITLPKSVRTLMGITKNDYIEIEVQKVKKSG